MTYCITILWPSRSFFIAKHDSVLPKIFLPIIIDNKMQQYSDFMGNYITKISYSLTWFFRLH